MSGPPPIKNTVNMVLLPNIITMMIAVILVYMFVPMWVIVLIGFVLCAIQPRLERSYGNRLYYHEVR